MIKKPKYSLVLYGSAKDIKREAAAILNEAKPADPAPSKKPAYLKILLTLATVIVTIAVYGAYAFITRPKGKIISPKEGSQTPRIVELSGYTKNIPPERRYVWATVDIESLGLCWPKGQTHKSNEPFKAVTQ